ncbi:MAG: CPBP family intramembrane metalloprotease [Lachnospiraceae bacterium]|nr:CPBP family intramembrane metalloprotease [Lachnospiraceae bacterium]
MNEQDYNRPRSNESIFKFIMPVLLMVAVQVIVQLFAGQLMFFYKGYKYETGTFDEFVAGYQQSLVSNKFTILVTIFSTVILAFVFLMWYRKEIIHAANMSLRKKCKIIGVLNWKIVPGIILIAAGMGIFATYVTYLITMFKPEYLGANTDMVAMIGTNDSALIDVLLIIYIVLISPVCQELVFRGLTLGFAERRMTFVSANIIQALLFATLSRSVTQMIYFFVFGLILGYIYYRTENIAIPVICNVLFSIARIVLYKVNVTESSLILFYILLFAAMAGAYLGIVLVKQSVKPKQKDPS